MTRHAIYEVFDQQKHDLLFHLLEMEASLNKVLVIVRTRDAVHSLTTEMAKRGIVVDSVHGKKKPLLIERALEDLKKGSLRVLVTTDASAINLNLSGIGSIVQVDFPELTSDYLSRLSEVEDGVLYTFESPHNVTEVTTVEELLGCAIPRERAEGFAYEAKALRARPTRNKTPKRGERSKPLQHKKKKWKPKKYTR